MFARRVYFRFYLFILGIPVDDCVCAFSIESAFRIIVDGFEVALRQSPCRFNY